MLAAMPWEQQESVVQEAMETLKEPMAARTQPLGLMGLDQAIQLRRRPTNASYSSKLRGLNGKL
jgi:hypothetical protein